MRIAVVLVASALIAGARAESLFIDSRLAAAYHYVDTYEIVIDAPPADVWPQLANVASWMVGLDMIHESGPYGREGEVFRLYEGQAFFAEVVKMVPGQLLIVANLPASMEDENGTGIAMLTMSDLGGRTLVSSFMSRHFHWSGDGDNPLRARRASAEFRELNRAMWEDRFFVRLRELVEPAR